MKKTILFISCLFFVAGMFGQNIDNGTRQAITDDMNYEELFTALRVFFGYSGVPQCKFIKGDLPSFFADDKRPTWPPDFSKDTQLPYKEKKSMLLKQYSQVIKYIKDFYCQPLEQLEKKYLTEITYYGKTGFCCVWHATALAQRGSAKAQYALGARLLLPYSGGDLKENILWLKLAGESGISDAYWVIGKKSYKEGAYEAAIDCYKKGSEANDCKCMFELGVICERVLRDYATALQWYVPAAKLGHYDAIVACARIYSMNTKNTRANYRLAKEYYQTLIEREESMKGRNYRGRIEGYKQRIKELELKIED